MYIVLVLIVGDQMCQPQLPPRMLMCYLCVGVQRQLVYFLWTLCLDGPPRMGVESMVYQQTLRSGVVCERILGIDAPLCSDRLIPLWDHNMTEGERCHKSEACTSR